MEQWKAIDGFPAYEVSDLGQVRRCKTGPILKPYLVHKQYQRVNLCQGGKYHAKRVHRLVALAFIPNPLNLPEVNHIKGKSNAASNLEWRSSIGNHRHASQNNLRGDGVTFIPTLGKYRARYSPAPNKIKYIGVFDTWSDAIAARNAMLATLEPTL